MKGAFVLVTPREYSGPGGTAAMPSRFPTVLARTSFGCLVLLGSWNSYVAVSAASPIVQTPAIGPAAAIVGQTTHEFGTFESGYSMWIGGRSVPLMRGRDAIALRLHDATARETVARSLTARGGALDGFHLAPMSAGSTFLVFETDVGRSDRAGSAARMPAGERESADRLIQTVAADPGIAFVSPVFYTEPDGLPLVATEEVIVGLKPGAHVHELERAVRSARVLRPLDGTTDQFILGIEAPRWTLALDVAEELARSPAVEWAEPNFFMFVRPDFEPGDEHFSKQWYLNNTGQNNARPDADVDILEAWDITQGSANVIVAVLDDGVELDHPDLSPNIAVNSAESAGNQGEDDDNNGYMDDVNGWDFSPETPNGDNDPRHSDPTDKHGTAVAGVALAAGNNAMGVAGSAFGCRLLPVRFKHGPGATVEGVAKSIYYAAGRRRDGLGTWRGADVINISYGISRTACIDAALDWAELNGRSGKGIPVIAAAGNDASGYGTWDHHELTYEYGVEPGTWYFEWRYSTDAATLEGHNTAWVAYVELPDGTVERFDSPEVPAGWSMSPETLTLTGTGGGDLFGYSVAGAGDINGDGFPDLIVGAYNDSAGGDDAGRAYVYYGGPGTDTMADLILTGAAAHDFFGYSVAGAGDLNDDGFADLIVGAYGNDAGGMEAGRAYVYFGGPTVDATADLVLTGEAAHDRFGVSVAAAGDVDDDGVADLIIGAYQNDAGGMNAGRAYVYHGGPSIDATADLILTGADSLDNVGISVAGAGDVNGDGMDDVIVGADGSDAGSAGTGRAYVYHGGPGMDATPDLTLADATMGTRFGYSVAGAGDFNHDGFDDLIVGAHQNRANGLGAGRAYVYFGGIAADTIADLTMTGSAMFDFLGKSVASAGDVNRDGIADVIVGADGAGGNFAGQVYIYYGGTSPDSAPDVILTGDAYEHLGETVAGPGDVSGDGVDDLIVGTFDGRAHVYAAFPWTIWDDPAHAYGVGRYVAQAGAIGNNGTSRMRTRNVVVTAPDTLRYRAWVSSQPLSDRLELFARNVSEGVTYGPINAISGSIAITTAPSYPANYSKVVAVGSSTDWDYRADHSQYGPELNLVASSKGGFAGVATTDRLGAAGYVPGDYYFDAGRTSTAAPLAAGVAALVLSLDPDLTAEEVRNVLFATCDKIGPVGYVPDPGSSLTRNDFYGYGRINARAALVATTVGVALEQPIPPGVTLEGTSPNPFINEATISFSVGTFRPTTLDVFDVSGRRVQSHDLGALPPGRHMFKLSGGTDLHAGVYFIRLTHGRESVATRVCLLH